MKKHKTNRNSDLLCSIGIIICVSILSFIITYKIPEPVFGSSVYQNSLNYEQSQASTQEEKQTKNTYMAGLKEEVEEVEETYIPEQIETSVIDSSTEEENIEVVYNEITLTEAEFDMLCRTVQLEAGYHSVQGQKNVLYVIFNRLYSENFPNSIKEIILVPNQFAVTKLSNFYTVEITDFTRENVKAATRDFQYGISAQGALYFRTSSGTFDWCEYIFTDEIGHDFYR